MEIKTERLLLRDFMESDLAAVHRYAAHSQVARYMLWGPNTREQTEQFLAMVMGHSQQSPRQAYHLAITLKQDGRLIGSCSLECHEQGQGEIGYVLHPDFWRNGYAAESAKALLDYGFNERGLHRIYATCRPENSGSAGVMKKLGMKYEGHLREHLYAKGRWHDSCQFSILAREFNEAF
ncbi:GNAT family N-acetyltransferase [Paenibacillus senegalensis]|uniref:GNAT family N-acetyltransferase n=1 Tax=Paenibacillus senegalensis TaxID=1465766 RepID=UPI000287DEC0|nr:GNAT family protein [Paenibacillus senegalensis]